MEIIKTEYELMDENDRSLNVDEDYEIWWLIMLTRRAMYKARVQELNEYGITPEEAGILFMINAIGHATTPAEISRWSLRERHSTSAILSRMQSRGLIIKVKDLQRKNLVRVAMTENGWQLYQQSRKRGAAKQILATLSEDERRQLRVYLEKVRRSAYNAIGIKRKPKFPQVDLSV